MKTNYQMPTTPFGDMIPEPQVDTRKTQAVTLASNATVYASSSFLSSTTAAASLTLGAAGDDTITFTSKIDGADSEKISVQVAGAGGSLTVAVTNKAILITPKADSTCADVKAAIEANAKANELVDVSYTLETAIIDATQAKAYLNGYEPGNINLLPVRVMLDKDGFIGTQPEGLTATKTASMPVAANQYVWVWVEPDEIITAKSATNGAKAYFTPAKKY